MRRRRAGGRRRAAPAAAAPALAARSGDRWIEVSRLCEAAARAAGARPARASDRRPEELDAFAGAAGMYGFLIRTIEPPAAPADRELGLARRARAVHARGRARAAARARDRRAGHQGERRRGDLCQARRGARARPAGAHAATARTRRRGRSCDSVADGARLARQACSALPRRPQHMVVIRGVEAAVVEALRIERAADQDQRGARDPRGP